MSEPISRREFIRGATAVIGGLITAVIGLPTIAYLIDPALREGAKEGWIPVGKLEDMPVGKPAPFSFTRVQVNGWERTSTSHGGFILRKSEDPQDLLHAIVARARVRAFEIRQPSLHEIFIRLVGADHVENL